MKAHYYQNGLDRRIMSVRHQENVLNRYEENKERIDPLVNIKVGRPQQFAHRVTFELQRAEQVKHEEDLKRIHNISKPIRSRGSRSQEADLGRRDPQAR